MKKNSAKKSHDKITWNILLVIYRNLPGLNVLRNPSSVDCWNHTSPLRSKKVATTEKKVLKLGIHKVIFFCRVLNDVGLNHWFKFYKFYKVLRTTLVWSTSLSYTPSAIIHRNRSLETFRSSKKKKSMWRWSWILKTLMIIMGNPGVPHQIPP